MTHIPHTPAPLSPGDRVEFRAASPLYALGLRSATVVAPAEPLPSLWARQAPRLGVSVGRLRRMFVERYRRHHGKAPPPGWEGKRQLVVTLDPGGPVWVAGAEVAVDPSHVRRV